MLEGYKTAKIEIVGYVMHEIYVCLLASERQDLLTEKYFHESVIDWHSVQDTFPLHTQRSQDRLWNLCGPDEDKVTNEDE